MRGRKMEIIGIIEDDELLNQALQIALKKEGFHTLSAFNYKEGIKLMKQSPQLLLVDINLPDGDGISLCREIRKYQEIPAIFLTGRDEEEDMINAFTAGADDYVVKPFPMRVLIKRIQAVLYRCREEKDEFVYRGLNIQFSHKKVFYQDQEIKLTAKEYKLLLYLARNKGQILSSDQILAQVWDLDGDFVCANTVSVTINRLRKKIEPNGEQPVFIKNVFGQGYRFGE